MYRIAICDDDIQFAGYLESILLRSKLRFPIKISVEVFHTLQALKQDMKDGLDPDSNFDLIILDIMFPSSNGVDFGKIIRRELNNERVQILYISSEQQYAMQLFDNRPLQFLIKPINEEKLIESINYAIELDQKGKATFEYQINGVWNRISCEEIFYFESRDKKINLHKTNGEIITFYGKLSNVIDALDTEIFLQIHKSYLINTAYVSKIAFKSVTLTDGRELPISQTYHDYVRNYVMALQNPRLE